MARLLKQVENVYAQNIPNTVDMYELQKPDEEKQNQEYEELLRRIGELMKKPKPENFTEQEGTFMEHPSNVRY